MYVYCWEIEESNCETFDIHFAHSKIEYSAKIL